MQTSPKIHLDLNKTVLVDDKVQGIDTATSCTQILYWLSWGHVEDNGRRWIWNGEEPSLEGTNDGAMLYGDFVRTQSIPRRRKKELKRRFLDKGQPGELLKPFWHAMMRVLTHPPHIRQALNDSDWASQASLDKGYTRLLPGFFKLLVHIHEQQPSTILILRTFGSDIPEVAVELNAFCRGEHPLYPGMQMDGKGGTRDARLHLNDPHRFGAFHRGGPQGNDPNAFALALGVLSNPKGRDRPPYPCPLSFFEERAHTIHRSLDQIWNHFDLFPATTLAYRDDYAYWARHRFTALSGKPLRIDRSSSAHEIFLDDNIFADDPHVIDVRDAHTGNPLSSAETLERHIFRVNPYQAVLDEDYFIRIFDAQVNLGSSALEDENKPR